MGNLPVVPYSEPEPWVPSGGFSEFRSSEDQARDAQLAAEYQAEPDEGLRSESERLDQ